MKPAGPVVTTGVRPAPRSVSAVRIAFGLVWAVDATLKWLPGFHDSFAAMLDATAHGQPGWLGPWFGLWTGLSHTQANVLAYSTALTETVIALAVLFGFARTCTYLAAATYSLLLWAAAEGFGGPYQSGATDIGTGIIYSFVFVGFVIMTAHLGPDRYSVDYWLERRVSWWWRLSEVRRPGRLGHVDLSAQVRGDTAPTEVVGSGTPPPLDGRVATGRPRRGYGSSPAGRQPGSVTPQGGPV
jgi:uncharacterized membrane protein YphA (DoxX/SURF4 family)